MPKWPLSLHKRFSPLLGADPARPRLLPRAVIAAIRLYRLALGPLLPPACRFTPSCSAFALEAVERHGAARGLVLALARVSRCHPWHAGGYDPVPARKA